MESADAKPDLGLRYIVSDEYLLEALNDPKYGDSNARSLVFNEYLTEGQCRIVNSRIKMEIYKSFLIKHKNYHADLLHEEALKDPDWFLAEAIMSHPKTSRETKVVLVLQGKIRPIFYENIEKNLSKSESENQET